MFKKIVLLIGLLSTGCQASDSSYRNIDVEEASRLIKDTNVHLLDVRTPEEYTESHIDGATLIPVSELNGRINELEAYRSKEIVVYCRSGSRSQKASEILTEKRFKVANVTGGIVSWQSANKPVRSGTGER